MAASRAGGGYSTSAPPSVMPEEQLSAWLEKIRLSSYTAKARDWCTQMGAVNVTEILENWQDFADHCNLKPLERRRVEKDAAAAAATAPFAAQTAQAPAPKAVAKGVASGTAAAGDSTFGPQDDPSRYTMLEELGSGATATVCKCRRSDGNFFAVKSINIGKLKLQPNYQRMSDNLHREVQILFTLRHPRIVCLHDVIEIESSKLHLVMELVEGGELFDSIVAVGAFTDPVARYVFMQIAEGLKYIHSKNIVYRDLKPENILVDSKASKPGFLEIKLSDFGHSKLINDGYSTALTRVGTPQYWAPEVAAVVPGKSYDQRVDLWSLGVVLYVMLVGSYPFDGVEEPIELQIKRADIKFQAPRRIPDAKAQDLIRALVKTDPNQRLPLEGCLSHAWISATGVISKMLKTCTETGAIPMQDKIPIPLDADSNKVRELRRDLSQWTQKFRCAAIVVHGAVEVNMQYGVKAEDQAKAREELKKIVNYNFPEKSRGSKLPTVQEERNSRGGGGSPPMSGQTRKPTYRLFDATLKVCDKDGAGLDLEAESGGMKVQQVLPKPGQPSLQAGDLIIKINEVPLRGTSDNVLDLFGEQFGDGVTIQVKRVKNS
eukprot:TRINITY_DN33676_c0_g1_i1.p1 TRINITY_DN33676_c0_g1~~TRINITY_DN33676_c0_g1_i1.p1  ORF type:complete len:603 (+),score=121.20 TRINITY_DN33676_c0_g1_i1:40-1848(+)